MYSSSHLGPVVEPVTERGGPLVVILGAPPLRREVVLDKVPGAKIGVAHEVHKKRAAVCGKRRIVHVGATLQIEAKAFPNISGDGGGAISSRRKGTIELRAAHIGQECG